MIAKACPRGKSATGLLRYLVGDKKAGHVVLTDADAKRINGPSAVRPDIGKPIAHFALSLPDSESLSDDQWREIVAGFVGRMGLVGHEVAAVVHCETGHQHCHIVTNRIAWDGTVWKGEWEATRAIEAAKFLESAHGLQVEAYTPTGRAPLTQAEIGKALRTGVQPTRSTLQELIDVASAERPTFPDFVRELEEHGVVVVPNVASTGRVSGLAYSYNGEIFKGSQLGKRYGWGAVQARIDYEQERDSAAIQECARSRAGCRSAGAEVGGPDGGRDGRTRPLDGEHYRQNDRCPAQGRLGGEGSDRLDKDHGTSDREDGRGHARHGQRLVSHGGENAEPTGRAVSAHVRSRVPVCGSRNRISKLAASLLSRLSTADQPAAGDNHDRHRQVGERGHCQVATVSSTVSRER